MFVFVDGSRHSAYSFHTSVYIYPQSRIQFSLSYLTYKPIHPTSPLVQPIPKLKVLRGHSDAKYSSSLQVMSCVVGLVWCCVSTGRIDIVWSTIDESGCIRMMS